jgi:hypothetical protein
MILWVIMLKMAFAGPYVGYSTQELCDTALAKMKPEGECVAFYADVIQVRPPRRKYYDEEQPNE